MVRLLIVDDSELDRDGLKVSLEDEKDLEIVGEAANGIDAVEMAQSLRPDVVLMDLRLPYKSGVEATAEIVAMDPPPYVIALTTYDTDRDIGPAMKAGASVHIRKDAPMAEMLRAIRSGGGGPSSNVPSIRREQRDPVPDGDKPSRRARDPFSDTPRPGSDIFSELELDALPLLIQGRTNAQIAAHFAVEEKEIRAMALKIYKTLGVKDRSGLFSAAYRRGIVK